MSKIYEALEIARKKKIIPEKPLETPLPKVYNKGGGAAPDLEDDSLTLYHNIKGLLPDISKPVILFIGSQSNEGTSTIAQQLAKTASLRFEKAVLVIDLDRSRPELQVFADVKPECDLVEVVKSGAPVEKSFFKVEESSLCVMPLYQQSLLNPKTLDSAKDEGFWVHLRDRFDLIIIDAPPATLFPDGLSLVRQADGVILVFEAERTRWPVALKVKEKIIQQGGKILGIVFNKRRFYIPEWLYKRL